jgi:hypothetical protein
MNVKCGLYLCNQGEIDLTLERQSPLDRDFTYALFAEHSLR